MSMLHEIHDHINQEVRINTRTDTIFVVTAIVFNLIMLGVGSALADNAAGDLSQGTGQVTSAVVLAIIFAVSILVNGISIVGCSPGAPRARRCRRGCSRCTRMPA